jgi:FkbM family methyltransferase
MSIDQILRIDQRPDTPLRVEISNVPFFDIDLGFRTNEWHRANNQSPMVEPFETEIFIELLSKAPRVLDIGANVGWYSCLASAASKDQARVHAFEPEYNNFVLLGRNASINGFHGIVPHQTALGAEDGRASLFLNPENTGDHRLLNTRSNQAIEVGIAKLDTVLASQHFIPDLVKIDVQGAELQVFDGAVKTFERAGKSMAVLMEFQPEALGLNASHALADRIFSFGRPVYMVHPFEGNQLQPLNLEVLHDAIEGCLHPRFDVHGDLIIAPDDSRMDRLKKWTEGARDWAQWAY